MSFDFSEAIGVRHPESGVDAHTGVGVGVGEPALTVTISVAIDAASPARWVSSFTALPQPVMVTLPGMLGAVHRNEKVTKLGTPDAAFGPVWVISASPPVPKMV
jgi:hypothetical protein